MLEKASSLLVLSADDRLIKTVMSIADGIDVEYAHDFSEVADHSLYSIIIAEYEFLKHLTKCREKVVVYHPGSRFDKMIAAGYERFLFNGEDKGEVLSACYKKAERKKPSGVFKEGEFVMDFGNHVFKLKGVEVYVTKSEEKFLHKRYVEKIIDKKSTDRVTLYRMRKRLGKEFLVCSGPTT